ncbi:MAG: TcfC E-set like domain-containing protein, partial [Paludibacteraceae bacterium]|nr:TcfC E-set like domain-containing protein [Paludibacteraceae bacterium]
IAWSDNRGGEGWLPKNTYHQQPYYPQWTDDPSYTLSGTRLPDNGHNTSETGQNWLLDAFDYGYADNWANTSEKSNIDIEWAVDAEGNPARLDAIHFVKVYNGIHQHCGWIGESSTEFCGIEDLHPIDAVDETAADLLWVGNPAGDWLQLCLARRSQLLLYRPDGRLLRRFEAEAGTQRLDCSGLPAGMYLLKSDNFIYKIIKH